MAKGKFKKFFKGALITLLSVGTALSAFAGCSCARNPQESSTPPELPKVTVEAVVEDAIGDFSFAEEYVMTVDGIAIENFDDFEKVTNVVLEAGETGTDVTITAETNAGEEVSIVAEDVQGDVFDWFTRGTKTDAENVSQIISELDYEADTMIVDNSEDEQKIVAYVNEVIDEFNETSQNVESATYTLIEDPTIDPTPTPDPTPDPEPPVEITYVTVENIVNDILGDIDVEADIQEVAQAIVGTKLSSMTLNEILAVDVSDGSFNIYLKGTRSAGSVSIFSFAVPYNSSEYNCFYDYLENSEEKINSILTAKGLNANSQIEENSAAHNDLVSELEVLEKTYEEEKTALSSTAKADIGGEVVFNLTELSADKMTELGITDMNDFSKALLNNTRGDGYEKVTSFTEDDIIATYVDTPGAVNINGVSGFNIVTITNDGIYKTYVYSLVQTSAEMYNKILCNSADAGVSTHATIVDYDNPIVYENGNRVLDEVASANPYALGRMR